jgi:hypothetical protein
LNVNILWSKSTNWGGRSLNIILAWGVVDETFDYFSIDLATSDSKLFISSSEGKPVNANILSIWSTVELPGKSGFWANISYMIQAKLQMSAGVE